MFRKWPRERVRTLGQGDLPDIVRLMRTEPLTALLAAQNLSYIGLGSQMLGIDEAEELRAICWAGSNLVPVGDVQEMSSFANYLRKRTRRATSIVGKQDLVMALWRELEPSWGPARDVRADQPCLAIRAPSPIVGDPRVRRATAADADLLVPAAVAMFTQEVGYDPTTDSDGYVSYVRSLAATGRSYIIRGELDGREAVLFKADIGAFWEGVAQLQGVWVHPKMRGQHLGTAAIAAVVDDLLMVAPVVSLYVNSYNDVARRVYEKVGFKQEATYATILL